LEILHIEIQDLPRGMGTLLMAKNTFRYWSRHPISEL